MQATTSASGGIQAPREVCDASLYFLQDELIKYIFEVRPRATAAMAAKDPKQGKEAIEESASALRDFGATLLEEIGFGLGMRLVERLVLTRARIWGERECIKFICKDLWGMLFQKQADRLQTNRRGGYVILDNSLPPLRRLAFVNLPTAGSDELEKPSVSTCPHHLPSTYLALTCGMIRGALTNLGFPCSVIAECRAPPSCSFQVRLK